MWANADVAHAWGAAWRRRQRRLRAHWRHEQLTLQMLLATYEHHAAPRGQSSARSRGEARDVLHGRVPGAPPSQGSREGTELFAMSEDSDVVGRGPAAGSRGCAAAGAGSAAHRGADRRPCAFGPDASRRCAADGGTVAPLDFRVAEQVIEVPKIVSPPRAARTVLRAPQTAEQLVEVPTVLIYSSLQQLIVEQTVDIPVPGRAGGRERGGLQGLPGQDSTAFFVADRVGIPGGGLQGSRPGQGSASSSSSLDHAGLGFFSHFSPRKKVRVRSALEVGTECGL